MAQDLLFKLVIFIGPLILAITVHEFSHVAMARFLGDDLGSRLGRFTLDPLKHIDPVWTIGLPALLIVMSTLSGSMGIPFFAAGKPAPYNPLALKRTFFGKRISIRQGEMLVAAAGPLSNLFLAFLSMIIAMILVKYGQDDMSSYSVGKLLMQFVYLNVALFIFNLIPIPPLDGSKVLLACLPNKAAQRFEAVGAQLSWVLLAFIIFGGGTIISYVVQWVVRAMLSLFI